MSQEVPSDVKAYIRAVLLSAPKGVKQTKFHHEYEQFANCKLEWRKMGFPGLYEFLLAIPDVARLEYSKKDAQNIIFGVNKKDIYASSHAKKAGAKGTGARPRHPAEWDKQPNRTSSNKQQDKMTNKRTVNLLDDSSTMKVTVANSSDLVTAGTLCANEQGLFGVYVGDTPKDCTKEELEMVFREYPTLKLCKIVTSSGSKKCGFAKFSTEQDALRALQEKQGYNLRGSRLKLRTAKEGASSKSNETHKSKESPPKSASKPSACNRTASIVFNEIELKEIYSRFGVVQKVDIHGDRKSATLKYANQGEALITLKNLKELSMDGQLLVLSLQQASESSLTVHIKEGTYKDNSRPNSSASISPRVSSNQESFFNFNDPSTSQQLQQDQTSRPHSSRFVTNSTSVQVERTINSFLTKEEMEKLCNASGHPLGQRFQGLPHEMDVLVTEIVDACRFWAIVDNKSGNWQQLQDLEQHLQKTRITTTTVPQKFTIGAGRFTENNVWYRCFVLDVSPDQKSVKVMYTDYGNIEWIPLERFSSLESLYLSLPPQANAFHLAGIELDYSNTKDKLQEGAQYLKQLIGDKTLIAKRKHDKSHQPHIIEVELFSKTPSNESINELMLKTNYVTKLNTEVKQDSVDISNKFKLRIAWVQSPTLIYYYLATKETEKDLENMEIALRTISVDNLAFPTIGDLVCVVLKDSSRRRAKILNTYIVSGFIKSVRLWCVDHGNIIKEAEPSSLLLLPQILKTIPPITKEAVLDGLQLPPTLNIWPKEALNVLINARQQVLVGEIVRRQDQNYTLLYDSNGELLNDKIMKTITEKQEPTRREELGTIPISPRNVSVHPDFPTFPKPKSDSLTTSNIPNQSRQMAVHSWPGNHGDSTVVSQQPNSQGLPLNAGFYMPPPPIDHKERTTPQGPHHVNTPPQETQQIYHPPHGNQNVRFSPQGPQTGNNQPQGFHKYSPQGPQTRSKLPQGNQSMNKQPQNIETLKNPAQGAQFQNSLTQGINSNIQKTQVENSSPQGTQLQNNLPQGSQSVVRHGPSNSALYIGNVLQTINNKNSQINLTSTPPQQAQTTRINGALNQLNIQEDPAWTKEREDLLAKRKEQEECIERLDKVELPKTTTPNLQELKAKLAKQVRIKELENQVLKLKKEVESLETDKAKLQLQLMDA